MKKYCFSILLAILFLLPRNNVKAITASIEDPIEETERTVVAITYTEMAREQMVGIYNWEEHRDCSSFVALYVKNLGIPVNWLSYNEEGNRTYFPWSNTVKQVLWAKENYPEYTHEDTLDNFLAGNLWDTIKPGDIVYLTVPVGHNGYNTYYHTAVLVGYRESGSPVFAEIAYGISASTQRTFEELTSFYRFLGTEPQLVGENTPNNLVVTWVDVISIKESELKFYREIKVLEPHLIK